MDLMEKRNGQKLFEVNFIHFDTSFKDFKT